MQAQLAELFGTTPQNITWRVGAIYMEGKLEPEATRKDYLQVRQEAWSHHHVNLTAHPRASAPARRWGSNPLSSTTTCAPLAAPMLLCTIARLPWNRPIDFGRFSGFRAIQVWRPTPAPHSGVRGGAGAGGNSTGAPARPDASAASE